MKTVNSYTNADKFTRFLANVEDEKVFLVISGSLGEHVVQNIHDMRQVDAIFIFCGNKSRHEGWAKNWAKIKGVFTNIDDVCECLKLVSKNYDQDSISIVIPSPSSMTSEENLDQLGPTFMYMRLFKEILLGIDFTDVHIREFTNYCRKLYHDNPEHLCVIDEFEREYHAHSPIWWYTRESFLYRMVNQALRTMDFHVLIKAGFLICDLHRQIKQLYTEQFDEHHHKQSALTVYRGQGMPKSDFDRLRKSQGGLISFDSFLSTSADRDPSFHFAQHSLNNSLMFGVLFHITVDPAVSPIPFAFVSDVNYFSAENEVLFSMHSVFRIKNMKQMEKHARLFQVDLTMTSDEDPHLCVLEKFIRNEIEGPSGWHRLGQLALQLGQFDDAEAIFQVLLKQTSNENEKSVFYHQLGIVLDGKGEYTKAIQLYEQSLQIRQKVHPLNHPDLAQSYYSIGSAYNQLGEYPKALSLQEKALAIRQQVLPPDHPDIGQSYNNIGLIFYSMGEHSKALSYFEKALIIEQKSLPDIHPTRAEIHKNMGLVYHKMKHPFKAISFCERAVDIGRRSLPVNHPKLQLWTNTLEIVKND